MQSIRRSYSFRDGRPNFQEKNTVMALTEVTIPFPQFSLSKGNWCRGFRARVRALGLGLGLGLGLRQLE